MGINSGIISAVVLLKAEEKQVVLGDEGIAGDIR
jgi:hypothetical protein